MALIRSSVNNALRDPLQGFDVDVYIQDQATGEQLINSRFTSFQMTTRNATEPYMEFNQRIMRLLDGEFQFGWVLEGGLVDVRVLQNTFGYKYMGREMRLSRSPRFQITVEMNAPELDETLPTSKDRNIAPDGEIIIKSNTGAQANSARKSIGRYRLMYAKTDSLTIGAASGRQVVAVRWEGLCEGVAFDDKNTELGLTPGTYLPSQGTLKYDTTQGNVLTTFDNATSSLPTWAKDQFVK